MEAKNEGIFTIYQFRLLLRWAQESKFDLRLSRETHGHLYTHRHFSVHSRRYGAFLPAHLGLGNVGGWF